MSRSIADKDVEDWRKRIRRERTAYARAQTFEEILRCYRDDTEMIVDHSGPYDDPDDEAKDAIFQPLVQIWRDRRPTLIELLIAAEPKVSRDAAKWCQRPNVGISPDALKRFVGELDAASFRDDPESMPGEKEADWLAYGWAEFTKDRRAKRIAKSKAVARWFGTRADRIIFSAAGVAFAWAWLTHRIGCVESPPPPVVMPASPSSQPATSRADITER